MEWKILSEKISKGVFCMDTFQSDTSTSWASHSRPNEERICQLYTLEEYRQNPLLIIDEFRELSTNQKKHLVPFLKQWMDENDWEDDHAKTQEIRDFIYEMF